ncbi:MAG: hypothetical protein AAFY71_22575 [Bacteroidota bacterium]
MILLALLSGFVLSFVGSLPPGIISLSVAKQSMDKGLRSAIILGLGASVVEFGQAFISFQFSAWISKASQLKTTFQWISIVVLILIGGYFMFFAGKPKNDTPPNDGMDFLSGMGISLLNVMAYPYWAFYGTYMEVNHWLSLSLINIVFLSLGVSLGTWILLIVYARLAKSILSGSSWLIEKSYQILAVFFFGLGAWQWIQLIKLF